MESLKWLPLLLLSCSTGEGTLPSAEPAHTRPQGLEVLQAAASPNAVLPVLQSLETNVAIKAQFAPKELHIEKSVPWRKHRHTEGDAPTLEFTAGEPMTLNVELMFDTFEKGDVHSEYIAKLEQLALIDEKLQRPPLLVFSWGSWGTFQGVVSGLNVKYTMFMPDGTPCRATVGFQMRQANQLMNRTEAEEANRHHCETDADCDKDEVCKKARCARTP